MKKNLCLFMAVIMLLGSLLPQMVSAYSYTVFVCTDVDGYLNMRSTPSSSGSGNIVAKLPDCVAIYISGISDNGKWGYGYSYDPKGNYVSGWVYLPLTRYSYDDAMNQAGIEYYKTVEVASYDGFLNLRSEAGDCVGNVIDVVYNGTVLQVTRKTDMGWGLVTYNGKKGWIKLSPYTKEFFGYSTAPSRTGAILGYAKYTDIGAYINHYPITSYNINGNTVVVAEDLQNYGFNVVWNEYARTLSIIRNTYANKITPYGTVYKYSSKIGQNYLPYLKTDIKTYVNGQIVESFNIDGKTCIYIDSLAPFGSVVWVPEARAIKVWIDNLPIVKDFVPINEAPIYY